MSHASGAYRALEIILGIVALAIGILALVFPEGVIVTIAVLFGIALFVIIESSCSQVSTAIGPSGF